jgi:hypothetical protein
MGRYGKFKIGDRVVVINTCVKGETGIVGDFDNPEPLPSRDWKGSYYDREGYIPVKLDSDAKGFAYSPYYLIKKERIDFVDSQPDCKPQVGATIDSSGMFCVCSSPNVVKRTTALSGVGSEYKYCLNCRKEVR